MSSKGKGMREFKNESFVVFGPSIERPLLFSLSA